MRRNLLAKSAFMLATSQFVSAQTTASVASRLVAQNALFDDAWQAILKMNPIIATAVGDYRYNDQLSDYSLAAQATRHQRDLADLARIKAIDPSGFPEQDQISTTFSSASFKSASKSTTSKSSKCPSVRPVVAVVSMLTSRTFLFPCRSIRSSTTKITSPASARFPGLSSKPRKFSAPE